MPPTNKAAFYVSDKAPALVVGPTPYPAPSSNEIVVRVSAVAINPVDYKVQELGTDMMPTLKYPLIGGLDVAGTIVELGSAVAGKYQLSQGDRVSGFPCEFNSQVGGFQEYVAVPADCVSKIPDGTSFVDAVVLPCCIATAAVGLYHYLGLEQPSASGNPPQKNAQGKTVLVAAGASSVGSNAIQLAVASGYEVFTTSSPRNFKHCTSLGAAKVFDYHSPTLVSDIKSALKGKHLAGAVSGQEGGNAPVFEVVAASEGSKKVACVILFSQEGVPAGITTEMIHAFEIQNTPLAETLFGSFLPRALASGSYKCEPKPLVVGKGLESVQAAFDIGKTGSVSCQKLVVTLEGEA
ncbi:GroES-like protein [Xylaria castorea]|nr:GroES-like protein [Xylaria castorea]